MSQIEKEIASKRNMHFEKEIEESRQLAKIISDILYDFKADDVAYLEIYKQSDLTDFFVVASAQSPPHLKALANEVLDTLADNGLRPKHIDGMQGLKWVAIDYTDVIVHLFLPNSREYYGLETYWADAPRIEVKDISGAGIKPRDLDK
jgi:ribosome-associated protein